MAGGNGPREASGSWEHQKAAKAPKRKNFRTFGEENARSVRTPTAAKVRYDLSVKAIRHHVAAEDHLALIAKAYHMGKTPPYTPLTIFAPCVSSCMLQLKSIKA
jgi:hypothetical protein